MSAPEGQKAAYPAASTGQPMSVVGHQRDILPCDAALAILRAIVARFRRAREERPIVERIDIDDAPHPVPVGQSHCDIDAAPSADNLLGRSQTEHVSLKLLRIGRRQPHTRLGIGKRPRVVLTAERALAGAERLLGWRPVGRQLQPNRSAVTLALEDHARSQRPQWELSKLADPLFISD
jgi:hypothetical protein